MIVGERARPEQLERHERVRAAGHQEREQRPARRRRRPIATHATLSSQRCAGRGSARTTSPPTASAATTAPSQSNRPRRLRVARLLDVADRRPQGDRHERHVDQERDSPADGVDEDAADDRPEQVSAEVAAAHMPNARAARRAVERLRDERERARARAARRPRPGGGGRRPATRGSAPGRTATEVAPKPTRPMVKTRRRP